MPKLTYYIYCFCHFKGGNLSDAENVIVHKFFQTKSNE